MKQLTLFDGAGGTALFADRRERLDADSERLLAIFRDGITASGVHHRSVKRDVSQLRAVLREARAIDTTATLRALLDRVDLLAQVLREPLATIARTTGRARLLAVQRFVRSVGPSIDRNPDVDLGALDAHLPAHRSTGWHTTGTLVAGTPGRRRRRGPTLHAADLHRLVEAVGTGDGAHVLRDRALVALHCFSGLRPEEIVGLRWEDLGIELTVNGHHSLTVAIDRGGRHVTLLLPRPASAEVEALAAAEGTRIEDLSGPVLCARGADGRALSYRAAREMIEETCRRAGLPPAESTVLRAACAHWPRSQGLSDHEVAAVLGFARVRSVDRLLQAHTALDAQRGVREMLLR